MKLIRPSSSIRLAFVVALVSLSVTACSSPTSTSSGAYPPPAAEPATSPPLAKTPNGVVVPAGSGAEGVAFDPKTGTVAVGTSSGVLLFDTAGRLLHSVSLPAGPRHIALQAPGGPFLVPAQGADELAFVDPESGRVQALVRTGLWPHDVVAAEGRVFVGNELGNSLSVIQGTTVVATIPVVTQPGGLASVGGALAIVGVRARRLELLGMSSLRPIAVVPAESGPSHVVSYRSYLYVVDTGGGSLLVYATRPRLHQIDRVPLPGSPLGMVVDPVHRRLWITLTALNALVEFNLSTPIPRRIATFATVRQPNSVGVDPLTGTEYVAGEAAGVLQILGPRVIKGTTRS
jgi:DNA-binding beta-propeller fold protein YncE